jgi:hypothetical protein
MRVKIGRWFEVDTTAGLYIKLPCIGAAHRYPGGGWVWDRWSTLKATGEV